MMKRIRIICVLCDMQVARYLTVVLLFIGVMAFGQTETDRINWLSFEEAVELNKENPKKVLIDIYTDWCGWCKRMDKDTYEKALIINEINANYYAVKLNAEQREPIEFDGHTFKFFPSGKRGVHELAAGLTQNKLSYPTTVFMDEEMKIIQPIPGYMKPDKLHPILKFIGEDHFKNTSWEEYQKIYAKSL